MVQDTELTVVLQPRPSNGCKKVSYLLPQNLTCVATTRITAATKSQITSNELALAYEATLGISAAAGRHCP